MSAITTHVLDTALGRPAAGVPVRLERVGAEGHDDAHHAWGAEEAALLGQPLGEATTDKDGRARDLGPDRIAAGRYRLVFDTASYFQKTDQRGFFPEVAIAFTVEDPAQHYHVPLLLSPYSYSTYRGS